MFPLIVEDEYRHHMENVYGRTAPNELEPSRFRFEAMTRQMTPIPFPYGRKLSSNVFFGHGSKLGTSLSPPQPSAAKKFSRS